MGEKTSSVLNFAFNEVKSTVFKRWERQNQWRVVYETEYTPWQGKCFSDRKVIVLDCDRLAISDELRLLLVHEICHSSAPSHDRRWQRRMLKAAERADKIGWTEVGSMVRKQVKQCIETPNVGAQLMYMEISDVVLLSEKLPSYEDVIRFVAHKYGYFPEELVDQYKRSRRVYDKAIKERRENDIAKERLSERIESRKSRQKE